MAQPGLPPLTHFFEYTADSAWRSIEFISDLHLSEDTPATVEAWTHYLRSTQADAVFILGDLFEVWIGDDARAAGGLAATASELLAEAAARRTVGFMVGNRDFLVGQALMRDCGLLALPDPSALDAWGQRVLLTHGDALCLADTAYQAFRAQVRSDTWRRDFLALPLRERERQARSMRDASEAAKRHKSPQDWADVDAAAAVSWMHASQCHDMVHGHTHRPGTEGLAPGYMRHVLSDWDCDGQPHRAQVLRLTRDGFTRHKLRT